MKGGENKMKINIQEKMERLKDIEEQLDKLDNLVTLSGYGYLIQAKQEVCLLKTIFYAEEQLNENKTCK